MIFGYGEGGRLRVGPRPDSDMIYKSLDAHTVLMSFCSLAKFLLMNCTGLMRVQLLRASIYNEQILFSNTKTPQCHQFSKSTIITGYKEHIFYELNCSL